MEKGIRPQSSELSFRSMVYSEFSESLFGYESSFEADRQVYAFVLSKIEDFVEETLKNDDIPFVPIINQQRRSGYDASLMASRFIKLLPRFIETVGMLSDKYEYSEYISAFSNSCRKLQLLPGVADWEVYFSPPLAICHDNSEMTAGEMFNALVQEIRACCRNGNYLAKRRARLSKLNRRYRNYCEYVNCFFDHHSRLIVIRIDLYYEKSVSESIQIEDAIADMNHLITNRRCNQIFRSMVGYIAKLEYGIQKGLHYHMLMFFNGAERKPSSHIYHTKQIGEYWKTTITKGRGTYWNSNAEIKKFEALNICGIGVVEARDQQLRFNLLDRVVRYLCKSSQYVRIKNVDDTRLIRRGLCLKKKSANVVGQEEGGSNPILSPC